MTRSDGNWVSDLTSMDLAERENASLDLRELLTSNLRSRFLKRGLSQDCVEDVVQESLLRVLDRLDTFRGESRFMTWVTAIGIRTGMELVRKQYWKTQTLGDLVKGDDVDLAGPWESEEVDPNRAIDQREILGVLSEAMGSVLSERQRTALLAELRGMPMSEIATELGSNRGAIYKMTHDARKKLKRELERRGFDRTSIESTFQRD